MLTVCRLCLAKDANFVIFNSQAAVRIVSCTGLEVDPKDKLPQLICSACRLRLEEFHHFRKRSHAADRHLRHLKLLDRNSNGPTNNIIDDKEDAAILKDVAQCSATACSESNAQWRRDAAQLIRTEIDVYKKNLLGWCRRQVRDEIEQQVRVEIEQQVRREMGELLLAQAKKECRLNMLDDLFYEIESLFVHKRNSAVREMSLDVGEHISDMEAPELERSSTTVGVNGNICEGEHTVNADLSDLNTSDMSVVEVFDDELPHHTHPLETESSNNQPTNKETTAAPTTVVPLTMVEINMQNTQYSHLREDLKSTHFLLPQAVASPAKRGRKRSNPEQRAAPRPRIPSKETLRSQMCQKHECSASRRYECKPAPKNCYRCRLRGSQDST